MLGKDNIDVIKGCIDERGAGMLLTDMFDLRKECEICLNNLVNSKNRREHRTYYRELKECVSLLNGAVLCYLIAVGSVNAEDVL